MDFQGVCFVSRKMSLQLRGGNSTLKQSHKHLNAVQEQSLKGYKWNSLKCFFFLSLHNFRWSIPLFNFHLMFLINDKCLLKPNTKFLDGSQAEDQKNLVDVQSSIMCCNLQIIERLHELLLLQCKMLRKIQASDEIRWNLW